MGKDSGFGIALAVLIMGSSFNCVAQEASVSDLEFIAPGDSELKDPLVGCGIQLGFSYVISSAEGSRSGTIDKVSADRISVATFKGAADGSVGKGQKQFFSRTIAQSAASCSVSFRAAGATEAYKKGRLMNLWSEPDFTPLDVLAQSYKFQYEFSISNEFPSTSVLANFDRLADKGCGNTQYSTRLGFDYRNGGSDVVYCVTAGEKAQPVRVSCGPYRNGSKCSFFAVLQAGRDRNVISAIDGAKVLREAVTTIVND